MDWLVIFTFFAGNQLFWSPKQNKIELRSGKQVLRTIEAPTFLPIDTRASDNVHFALARDGVAHYVQGKGSFVVVAAAGIGAHVLMPNGSTLSIRNKASRLDAVTFETPGGTVGLVRLDGDFFLVNSRGSPIWLGPAGELNAPKIIADFSLSTADGFERDVKLFRANVLLVSAIGVLSELGERHRRAMDGAGVPIDAASLDRYRLSTGELLQLRNAIEARDVVALGRLIPRLETAIAEMPNGGESGPVTLLLRAFSKCGDSLAP